MDGLPLTPSPQYTWMGGAINRARKRLNVPYPNLYAPPGEWGAQSGAALGTARSRLAGTAAGRAGTALSKSVWRSERQLVRAHQRCATLARCLSNRELCRPPTRAGVQLHPAGVLLLPSARCTLRACLWPTAAAFLHRALCCP